MLEGLEISEILKSDLEYSGRLDSEYYRKHLLFFEDQICKKSFTLLDKVANFLIGPFGSAFDTENYVENGDYRYVRGQDVKPFILKDGENRYVPFEDFERLKKYALKEKDILVSVVGTLGNACIVQNKDLPAIFSCKSTVIRTSAINPVYVLTFLNCKYGRELLIRKERGAIQKGLNLDDLKTSIIPSFPDTFQLEIENLFYDAQSKIAESKSLYFSAETLLLETLGLKDFEPSTDPINVKSYKESFLTSGRLDAEFYQPFYEDVESILKSKGFDLIQDICTAINYGTVPTSPYTDDGSGIPYIKGMNIKNTEIKKDKLDFISNTEDLPNKFYTKKGDIIISQMGTVGDVGVISEDEEVWLFASFTIRIRIKEPQKYNPYFVGLYIQNIAKPYYLLRYIAQASVRQNTDLPTIRNMYLPKVDYSHQEKIAALVEESFNFKKQSEQLLETAKRAVEIAIEQDEEAAMRYIEQAQRASM